MPSVKLEVGATIDHEELPSDDNAAFDHLDMKEKADPLTLPKGHGPF
jgi:hypothetical protein